MDIERERRGAVWVIGKLRAAGYEAYLVGGCVRDRLLGRRIKEHDIATDATPDQVMSVFRRTVPVGAQFGVVLVLAPDGEYEVATFRAEASYTDGRRPDAVRFVSAREDVLRRDFTINGLLEDPDTGEIRDFVMGREDLARRTIRAIGDPRQRFAEDHLRMLRAVRFSATLGFDIEAKTLAAIIEMAPRVSTVAAERVSAELRRTFSEGDAVHGFTLAESTGILTVVLPELPQGRSRLVAAALGALTEHDFPAVLAVLLDGLEPSEGRAVAERLRLSKQDREALVYLLREGAQFHTERKRAQLLRFIREPLWLTLAAVQRALTVASQGNVAPIDALVAERAQLPRSALYPPRLLDGRDLKAIGLTPGPHFKRLLNALEDRQLEGAITTRDEAERFARDFQ